MSSAIAAQQAGLPLQALAVALQHPAVAADQHIVCTLLQVCKAWRLAVEMSAASLTDCKLSMPVSIMQLVNFSSFAGWLAKHRGLVCNLEISSFQNPAGVPASVQVAFQLIELGMQRATTFDLCGAPLRLRSYSSHMPATAGLLAALPAATLTHLEVSLDTSNWLSAISCLTNLRNMHLGMAYVRAEATDSCLRELGKLQQLTQLHLQWLATTADMRLLPAQLQHLQLQFNEALQAGYPVVGVFCHLQHLAVLQKLHLTGQQLAAGSSVPPNLESLYLAVDWPADGLVGFTSLQQLTKVDFVYFHVQSEHFKALEQLLQLKDLSIYLNSTSADAMHEVAAASRKLPLLSLRFDCVSVTPAELQHLMQDVAAVTQLTKLCIADIDIVADAIGEGELAVCEHLRALTNLQKLSLGMGGAKYFAAHDAQHLSSLTTLTHLALSCRNSGPCVDATVLSLLALTLTRWRHLARNEDGEEFRVGISALPAGGRLTTLEELRLEDLTCEDARRDLQLLTGLSRLHSLAGFHQAGLEAHDAFWHARELNRKRVCHNQHGGYDFVSSASN